MRKWKCKNCSIYFRHDKRGPGQQPKFCTPECYHDFRKKTGYNMKGTFKKGHTPWTTGIGHSTETRTKIGLSSLGRIPWNKGLRATLKQIRNLSIGWNKCNYFWKGGYRKDLGHYVRSSWEASVARYLKRMEIDYVYEPQRFYLKELDCTYCPDFYLPDTDEYIEVKGWDTKIARAKRNVFRKQYKKKLMVIGKARLKRLKELL